MIGTWTGDYKISFCTTRQSKEGCLSNQYGLKTALQSSKNPNCSSPGPNIAQARLNQSSQ